MQRRRTRSAHRAPAHAPIRVAAGDTVVLGQRDSEWPQYVWATLADGQGGWIPAQLFDAPQGRTTALGDYDTRELDVEAGEWLTLHHALDEWWWVEDPQGRTGWVPARILEPAPATPAESIRS